MLRRAFFVKSEALYKKAAGITRRRPIAKQLSLGYLFCDIAPRFSCFEKSRMSTEGGGVSRERAKNACVGGNYIRECQDQWGM
jgi:hypothetical protein